MTNRYPIYIVSKGRADNALTPRALDEIGLPYSIIVEADELDEYKTAYPNAADVIVLPDTYKKSYELLDNHGLSKSTGPGPARNFALDLSIQAGYARHWVMDDNLDAFHRLHQNEKFEVRTPATFIAMEDFVDRYENIMISGPNYYSFAKKTDALPPFITNTRIYSCLLIDNNIPFRWRGRYNEDTILSLDVLSAGYCTLQFNAFLCGKVTTQRMKGGNTKEFYDAEGTRPKSQMLADAYPEVAKVVWRHNRWHHHVNYKPFKKNQLKKLEGDHPTGVNNYGMVLLPVDKDSNPLE